MLRSLLFVSLAIVVHSHSHAAQTPLEPTTASPAEVVDPGRAHIRFRLVDQHEQPVAKRSFYYANTGSNQQLDSLGDGFYILSFDWRSSRKSLPTILLVADANIEPSEHHLRPRPGTVVEAGVIRVHRFDEKLKRKTRIRVVTPDGENVPGATIVASPKATTIHPDAKQRTMSDKQGIAELEVYPTRYYVHAVHDNHLLREAETFDFESVSANHFSTIVVYPLPEYSIDLSWMEFNGATNEPVDQDAVQLSLRNGELVDAREQPDWINAIQVNGRVGFQFPNASQAKTVRKKLITAVMVNPPSDRLEFYNSLRLSEPVNACPFVESPNWTIPTRGARKPGQALTAIAGDIVIGALEPPMNRADANYIRFKLRVNDVAPQEKQAAPPSEARPSGKPKAAAVVAESPTWLSVLTPYAALPIAAGLLVLLLYGLRIRSRG